MDNEGFGQVIVALSDEVRMYHARIHKATCILRILADSVTSAYGKQEIQRALRALEGLEK